jgi:serine/threonine protein kinase
VGQKDNGNKNELVTHGKIGDIQTTKKRKKKKEKETTTCFLLEKKTKNKKQKMIHECDCWRDNQNKFHSDYVFTCAVDHQVILKQFRTYRDFSKELRLLRTSSPFFPSLVAAFDDEMVLAMKKEKEDLLQYCQRQPSLMPSETVVRMCNRILESVAAFHQLGMSHRDIKPDNLLVTSDGNIKICDFEMATSNMISKTCCGTESYMSPGVFQCLAFQTSYNTRAADVWSAVIAMFVVATMNPPFLIANHEVDGFQKCPRFQMIESGYFEAFWASFPQLKDLDLRIKSFFEEVMIVNEKDRPCLKKVRAHPFLTE